jgi:hypothetical protein
MGYTHIHLIPHTQHTYTLHLSICGLIDNNIIYLITSCCQEVIV